MPLGVGEIGVGALLLKYIWVPILTLIGKVFWDESRFKEFKKEYNRRVRMVETSLTTLEATAVTEQQVRDVLKEALEPFFTAQVETREDIRAMNENITHLRIDFATETAIAKRRRDDKS